MTVQAAHGQILLDMLDELLKRSNADKAFSWSI